VAGLEALTAVHPLRERFWYQRMLTLYRAGRQADALRAYRELRDIMVTELAIEPAADLRELQARILRQDPALKGPARQAGAEVETVPPIRYAQTGDGIHIACRCSR
jgi:DNA-binding SARP family transcriptional activator